MPVTNLLAKGIDMIAANNVADGQGFDQDDNALQVFWRDGETQLARTGKSRLARQLVEVSRSYMPANAAEQRWFP